MSISRRGFLKGLLGGAVILGAPAIVRSESLMKIWVPPQEIIIPSQEPVLGRGMTRSIFCVDEAAFGSDFDGDVISIYNLGNTIGLPPEWNLNSEKDKRIRQAVERAGLMDSLKGKTVAISRYPIINDGCVTPMKV